MYQQGNSRAVNARLRNFQYVRTGATDLLPLRDVYAPGTTMSIIRGNYVREASVKRRNKTVQEITYCSKCFQFLCNNNDRTCFFFNTLTFARSQGGVENRGLRPWFSTPSSGPGECYCIKKKKQKKTKKTKKQKNKKKKNMFDPHSADSSECVALRALQCSVLSLPTVLFYRLKQNF